MSNFKLPLPKDFCDLLVDALPDTLSAEEKIILTATCKNLQNEAVTPNQLYNSVLTVLPTIQAFFNDLQVETYIKDTFKGYSEIWVPVQFLLFIALIFVVVFVMIITGKLPIGYGILIIIVSAVVFTIIGIAEFDSLVNYLNSREDGFKTLAQSLSNKYKSQALLNLATGYTVGSSMGTYSPDGPYNINPFSVGPTFVTLDSTSVTHNLENPYAKVTIFKTDGSGTYPVHLSEPQVDSTTQMVKPSYPKYQYIVNYGPGSVYIDNASTGLTVANDNNKNIIGPNNTGTGVTIDPGKCRGFVNVTYSNFLTSTKYQGSISASNWVLVT